jgi:hypothetical protein
MRAISSSENVARFEVFAGIYETVCLGCNRLLGGSKDLRGLDILEKAHKCTQSHAGVPCATKSAAAGSVGAA